MNITKHATYSHQDVEIQSRETLYSGFLRVEKVSLRHRLFNQTEYTPTIQRELIQRKEAAGVLIYNDQQKKFALIEQFRIGAMDDPVSPWQLEIIAGVLDGDESPETCIKRESLEESGCELNDLQHIFSFYPSAGACDEIFHLYTAQAILPETGGVFGMPDEGENIQLHIFDYAALDELLQSGRLCNAAIIIALQWLKQHLLALKIG
ncbi:NUDIX domain-containing protein [Acinetobacter sichuanensis]|uniref:ADP-ribose pyrophosphatase n=1 Tax=Acinetobacter sichuanensis TaxID=2136183 RepID=A0A371YPG4_9GAMM|nr:MULTISPECIES: NUDIX domain-containing protein [Acinetobacter]MDM1249141.1 NUDIX domain-containing protein [Acinetobacter sp. R933-2]RFC83346.1 NUDIX domain-containing protein [Acinetobacter sichuanensis]